MENLKAVVEAVIFASGEPLPVSKLTDIIPESSPKEIQESVIALKEEYRNGGRPFTLEEIAGGYQFLTKPEYNDWILRLKKLKGADKLSSAALETLSIIAYKQPVRRVDIESIRGVQSGPLIRALLERGLIKITGREDIPGSPLLYGTAPKFLETFGLQSIGDLPKPEEMK